MPEFRVNMDTLGFLKALRDNDEIQEEFLSAVKEMGRPAELWPLLSELSEFMLDMARTAHYKNAQANEDPDRPPSENDIKVAVFVGHTLAVHLHKSEFFRVLHERLGEVIREDDFRAELDPVEESSGAVDPTSPWLGTTGVA